MEIKTETHNQQAAQHMRERAARLDQQADQIDALMIRTKEQRNKVLTQALDPAYDSEHWIPGFLEKATQLQADIATLNEARVAISIHAYQLRGEATKLEEKGKYTKN